MQTAVHTSLSNPACNMVPSFRVTLMMPAKSPLAVAPSSTSEYSIAQGQDIIYHVKGLPRDAKSPCNVVNVSIDNTLMSKERRILVVDISNRQPLELQAVHYRPSLNLFVVTVSWTRASCTSSRIRTRTASRHVSTWVQRYSHSAHRISRPHADCCQGKKSQQYYH